MSKPNGADERLPKMVRVQPYLFAYGACISIVSPSVSCYQLAKLYNRYVCCELTCKCVCFMLRRRGKVLAGGCVGENYNYN